MNPGGICGEENTDGGVDSGMDAGGGDAASDVTENDVTENDATADATNDLTVVDATGDATLDAADAGDATLQDASSDAPPDVATDALDAGSVCNSQAACVEAGFPAEYVCCELEAGPTCQAPYDGDGSPGCFMGSFCGALGGPTQLCQTNHECDPACAVDSGLGCSCSMCSAGACMPN
jgi:hypothetical protein